MERNYIDSLSDEALNSLVDNEYSIVERAELLAYLQTDGKIKEKVCEINHIKDRVQTAYADVPQPIYKENHANFNKRSIAASLLFVFLIAGALIAGLGSGLFSAKEQRLVILDPAGRGQQLSQNSTDELRVIFHVSKSTRFNAEDLLDDIEGLLQQSMENNQQVRIEVVAHAAGLDLLRESLSTEKKRIATMSKKYPELTFVACSNTIERLKREKGIDVKLISNAVAIGSGVAHVIKRQQQGWVYIQV